MGLFGQYPQIAQYFPGIFHDLGNLRGVLGVPGQIAQINDEFWFSGACLAGKYRIDLDLSLSPKARSLPESEFFVIAGD